MRWTSYRKKTIRMLYNTAAQYRSFSYMHAFMRVLDKLKEEKDIMVR